MKAKRIVFSSIAFVVCAFVTTVGFWYRCTVKKYEDTADMLLYFATNCCHEFWQSGIQADTWGRSIFVSKKGEYPVVIRSAGYDGVLFTADDISLQIKNDSCYSVSLEWSFGVHSSSVLNFKYSSDCH